LVGGDERVREAHRESVRDALGQLEHCTQARIGGNLQGECKSIKFVESSLQGGFCLFAFGHVHDRPNVLNEVTGIVKDSALVAQGPRS